MSGEIWCRRFSRDTSVGENRGSSEEVKGEDGKLGQATAAAAAAEEEEVVKEEKAFCKEMQGT